MTQPGRQFRYPLDSSLKKHRWDEQALRQELATARDALGRLQERRDALLDTLRAIDADVACLRTEPSIDLDRQQRLLAWRGVQELVLAERLREVADADAALAQITQQLARTLNSVRGHESYRERLAQAYDLERGRQEARRSDDEWLVRTQWLETHE